jgi:hypothetical protein
MLRVVDLDIDGELSGDTGVWEIAWVEYPAIEQELIYFGKQKFYKATQAVSDIACRAIRENEERGNPAGTQVGKVRAQQLCQRNEISLETVKRMKSFLERAATYNSGNWDDNGTIAYGLWGGEEALKWVDNILESIETQEQMDLEGACWEGWEARGLKEKDGRMVPNCVRVDASKQEFVYPNAGETKDEFIARCMGETQMVSEYPREDQRYAVCNSYYDRKDKFFGDRVGFDWEVLQTSNGLRLFKNELSRGNFPVIFIQGIPQQPVYDFLNEYRIPSSAINQYGTRYEKVDLIEKMGLPRHYDDDLWVRTELGKRAVVFDYDTSALPAYDNYPESGDTDSMLVQPQLPPVLFNEDCGCYKQEEFELLGFIDGMPIFDNPEQAELYGEQILGCGGYHTHEEDGETVYMPCEIHPVNESFSADDYDEDEVEVIKLLNVLREKDKFNFEAVLNSLARGFTRDEIVAQNHNKAVKYFKYKRVLSGSPDRDFCTSIEDRYFRRLQIDALRDYNRDFGHNKEPYSKWLYKGGPNCVHAWEEWVFQGKNGVVVGMVGGLPGQAPKSMPNNGYYSPETKRKSEVAYIISQQNMNKENFGLEGDLTPLGYVTGYPVYEDPLLASDASYAIGCGGITETTEYEGKKVFMACSTKTQKPEVQQQIFKSVNEKRMVYTPLMIPNILIPRMDEVTGERYFVKFKPEVIEKIQQKFMIEQRLRETNLEHTNKKFSDAVLVESWIVSGEKDKAYELGFTSQQVPQGTWMGGYKVLDTNEGNEVWDKYIKTGKVRGMSVEGNFLLNFSRENNDEYLLERIINILKKTDK